ncbi:hypothetical protein SAMN05216349_105154 [Oribacterium sp. KHPX15]|uniref:hypothetical protein n=1 Tax=Oribacterium sp. KHPX15 TaxID=1855342 RepID=UPI000899985C|nr:hypothetical protein [Oribacterium sp. KHPX15]SEA15137.1 hypothetical protein SAMN05216349_105154 [Oribacterium sp. KHPX15]
MKRIIPNENIKQMVKRGSAAGLIMLLLGTSIACGKKPTAVETTAATEATTEAATEAETTEAINDLKEITGKVSDAAMHSLVLEDKDGKTYELSLVDGVDTSMLQGGVEVGMDVTVELDSAGDVISIRPAGTELVGETEEAESKEAVSSDEVKQLQSGVKTVADLSYDVQNAGAISGVVIEASEEDGTIVQTVEGPVEFTVSKETDKSAVGGKVNPGDGVRVFFNEDGDALSLESMDMSINNPDAAVAAGEVILDVANNDFKSFASKVQYPILVDGKEYADAEALEKAKDSIWTPELIKAVVTEDLLKTAAKDAGIFIGKDDGPYVLINNDMVFEISGIAVRKVVQN